MIKRGYNIFAVLVLCILELKRLSPIPLVPGMK